MFSLFKTKPIIDQDASLWLFDAFEWALTHFDPVFFAHHSQIILPTNAFFPTRARSISELANSVFDQVRQYCGLTEWPFELIEPEQYVPQQYLIDQPLLIVRGEGNGQQNGLQARQQTLNVSYDPVQINQPQVMVANYAAMLANYLLGISQQAPPGGVDHRAPAVEVLAIFMGFGVMFANTAYAFRGSCGSCHNHAANRTAVLTENEAIYALAIFCVLKSIELKPVLAQLKKHLRPLLKQAIKDIKAQPEAIARLNKCNAVTQIALDKSVLGGA